MNKTEISDVHSGLLFTIAGTFFFSLMAASVYAAELSALDTPVLVSSFMRLVVNLLLVSVPYLILGKGSDLIGDMSLSLFLRGLFGSISLIAYFCAIKAIGIGESAFLRSSSGVFVVLLAPLILKEKISRRGIVAILGAICGLYLMLHPRVTDINSFGRMLGLGGGLFAALAWLMVSLSGRKNKPVTVIFYFCFIGSLLHLLVLPFYDLKLPEDSWYWTQVCLSGVFATIGQLLCTRGYQLAPAHLNSAVEYLGPVINLVFSVYLFGRIPDQEAFIGAVIVTICGVLLPFWRIRRTEPVVEMVD